MGLGGLTRFFPNWEMLDGVLMDSRFGRVGRKDDRAGRPHIAIATQRDPTKISATAAFGIFAARAAADSSRCEDDNQVGNDNRAKV